MHFRIRLLFVLLLPLTSVGCIRGVGHVLEAREAGEGTSVVYPVTFDQAWDISMAVLRWERSDTIEQHRTQGYMLTTIAENYVSKGCVVGVWIESGDASESEVTVISLRRIATHLMTGMTETRFHTLFKRAVNLLKEGKPLPLTTPPSS